MTWAVPDPRYQQHDWDCAPCAIHPRVNVPRRRSSLLLLQGNRIWTACSGDSRVVKGAQETRSPAFRCAVSRTEMRDLPHGDARSPARRCAIFCIEVEHSVWWFKSDRESRKEREKERERRKTMKKERE
eukprot:6191518-Pleurochrysis_carterae.AAC.1